MATIDLNESATAKLNAVASALEKLNAAVGTSSKEAQLATVKQLLPNVGAALVALGVVSGGTWSAIATLLGAVLSLAGWGWAVWDDKRTAAAVAAANADVDLAAKVSKINAAVDAAVSAKAKESGGGFSGGSSVSPSLAGFLSAPLFYASLFLGSLAIGTGCAHKSAVSLDNTDTLLAHPQFVEAAKAAPEFTKLTLNLVALLEREVREAAWFGVEEPDAANTAAGNAAAADTAAVDVAATKGAAGTSGE